MPKAPEYQPVAGIIDVTSLSDVQDRVNRAYVQWMQRMCRYFRLETSDPGVLNDERDNVEPGTTWVNTSTNAVFFNVDNAVGASVWTAGVGTGGVVTTASVISTDAIATIADNTQTTVDTHTASGADLKITKITMTGTANATWSIEVDSVEKFEFRLADGNKTRDLDFSTPLVLADGSTIDIKAEHFFSGETANFKATILGYT